MPGHPNFALLEAADTTSAAMNLTPGGSFAMFCGGTFDGATVEFQVRARGAAGWITLSGYPRTGAHVLTVTIPSCEVRLVVNSPGGSTAIDAHMMGFS